VGGFVADPYTRYVKSGGPITVTFLGSQCRGHVTESPDFYLNFTPGSASMLRFYFLGQGDGDTTLIVRSPDGYFRYCNDDSFGTKHPTVDVMDPVGGGYAVWVGSYASGEFVEGTLFITELDGNHP
jgi:hypothetical protein